MIPSADSRPGARASVVFPALIYASLGASCLLAGCGRSTAPDATTVRDSAGVTIVENDDARAVWTPKTAWRLARTPAIQIGARPGEEGQTLYKVRHSLKLHSGSFAVANSALGDVRLFDSGGYFLRSIPMPKDGNAEPLQPIRLYDLSADSLLVVLADHSVAVFDTLGALKRRSAPLVTELASDPRPAFAGISGDGTLLLKVFPPEDTVAGAVERTHVRFLTFRNDGTPLGSLGDFEDLTVLRGDGYYIFGADGVEATGDSTLWYGPADRFELREVALDGSTRRIVRLNRRAGEVTSVDTTAYRHSAVGELMDSLEESAALEVAAKYRYAERFPSYARVVVDESGNLWVAAYQWFGLGQPQKWTVFDREGRFLGDLTMPNLMEVHQIGEDFVLGRMAEPNGKEGVFFYPLIKPSTPAEGTR
jgi:hypothetical protein